MKRRLRLFAWVLTLTILCELLPFGAVAQSDVGQELALAVAQNLELDEENGEATIIGKCGDNLQWSLSSDGVLTIDGTGEMYDFYVSYTGPSGSVRRTPPWENYADNIKSVIIHYGVTRIGYGAFARCAFLTSVSIPVSVTSIGDFAFEDCTSLVVVNIPENLTSISSGTFYGCTSLATVNIPKSVTSIGHDAFNSCSSLTSVNLPESVNTIGPYAFSNCTSLTSVILSTSILYIREYAFNNCSSLISLDIPDSVISIGSSAFSGCTSLVYVNIPKSVTSIANGTFLHCTSLASIILPESITSISYYAFCDCTSLTSISIPNAVTSISSYTFYGCTSLTSIVIPESITSIGSDAFAGQIPLSDVYYSGTQDQWNTISIGSENDALLNAAIHYQSTGPEDVKAFEFERDNLSFLNEPGYYFQGDELDYWLYKRNHPILSSFTDLFEKHPAQYAAIHLSTEKFNQLTRNLSPATLSWFKRKIYSGDIWGGSCYGMILVAGIHYMAPDRIPFAQLNSPGLDNSSPTSALPAPVDNRDVEDLINYYLASQLLPTHYKTLATCLYNCSHDYDGVLKEITTALSQGIPVFASFANHEILLVRVKENASDHYVLGVYDPNYSKEQPLTLYKSPYIDKDGDGYLNTEYHGEANYIMSYTLASDLDLIDVRNYFNTTIDHETSTDYNDSHITIDADSDTAVVYGGQYYYRSRDGKLIEKNPDVKVLYTLCSDDDSSPSTIELVFPKPSSSEDFRVELSSDDINNASLLLNDTLLSISTSGPVELTYNEAARTVDVTAEDATDVNLLMTKNDIDENWPWHSWALDTTGTTTLHAKLDDEGLHLSGDGITNAKYATENADTENVDSGTISVQPDADGITTVTITSAKGEDGSSDKTEIKPDSPTDPSEPDEPGKHNISITGGTITQINDDVLTEPVLSCTAEEGDVITIIADDLSSENQKFTGWVVKIGDITLKDTSAPTTTFTMGKKTVIIEAQYKSASTDSGSDPTPTPTPTPGGGGSSGGGGGGGAAIVLGVGVAAAVTAGVILAAPVEVKGRVELADHAAIAGAKVSLLQNGSVVAQTTADENGTFSLKAKRGSYELTVAYTDANGQIIHKTIDIKAPAKDLTVIF